MKEYYRGTEAMHEQNIVVTCNISTEQKALLLEVLGSGASLTFLDEIPSTLHDALGSPHNSAVVPHILSHAVRQAAENIKRFIEGEKVMGIVPREDCLW